MPPKGHTQDGVSSICLMCSEGETDHMVQCDSCDKWYHYDCVGVNSDVADVSWSCEFCLNSRSTTITTSVHATMTEPTRFTTHPQASSSPSTSSQAISNALQNNQPDMTRGVQMMASSLVNANFPLLPFHPAPMVTTGTSSVPNQITTASYLPSGTTALFTNAPNSLPHSMYTHTPSLITWAMHRNAPQSFPYVPSKTSQSHRQQHLPATSSSQHELSQMTSEPATFSQHTFQRVTGTASSATLPTVIDVSQQKKELQMEMLEEEKRLHQRYLERKYQILSNSEGFPSSPQNNFQFSSPQMGTTFISGPSPAQIAARQVLPKQLPLFNGDPEEWPLFFSSFNNSTELAGYSDAENLIRLQASLKGKAREIVRNKLLLPSLVPEIIQTLKMYFGRPEYIIECMIDKARKLPPPKDKLESIIEFALLVSNICSTMEACQMSAHLNNPMLVKEFVDKLPGQYKLSWAMQLKDEQVPVVKAFSNWLHHIAEAASQVVSPFSSKKSGVINTHTEVKHQTSRMVCIACNGTDHKISRCEAFKKMSYNQKWELLKNNKLCRQCLNTHRRRCYLNNECGVDSCKAKHHPLLHKPAASVSQEKNQVSANEISVNPSEALNVNTHSDVDEVEKPYFRIIPIRLHSKNSFIDTFAFLDEGSSVTLMERQIFDVLGLSGVSEPLCLRWTGDTTRAEETSMRTAIQISSKENNAKHTLTDVHTVENLSLPKQSLDMNKIAQGYPYLAGLPIQSYKDARPTILIGLDNWKLAVPLKVREGSWNQPIATKTRLGWALQGCVANRQRVCRLNIHSCDCDRRSDELHEAVKAFFALESSSSTTIRSQEDERALQILETTCKPLKNRYEVGLLWRHDNQKMPESYKTAFNRLMCLHKKFKRDTTLKNKMQAEMDNLLVKGYARKLNAREVAVDSNPVWYLPIFVTVNPNKPNRVRLVWDAAAKSDGHSLNDYMLSGPDLLTPLVAVLLAFRIGQVAISGDIAEMFHQIKVRDADMNVQRFLWWDKDDPSHQPSCYVMSALTFGMNCAACIAHYIRNKNADQFEQQYPRAVEAIKNHHYVDDFIDSVDTMEDALRLANEVKAIHWSAGFHIRNWASNSSAVVDELNSQSSTVQAHKTLGSPEKVLGMYWDPNNDVFKYTFRFARLKRDVLDDQVRPTKRETLKVLMSIFDPLGFVACFTIGLKILLQEVWRSGIDWDDELSEVLYSKWLYWKSLIPAIKSIEIPRCYNRLLANAEDVQLHTFVDAGEHAYAAVCYLRVKCGDNVCITLVASKSKVAPLKPVSIPRLELQAAVLGLRLSAKIQEVRRIPISSRFWWSDSKTVLKWLRMDPRKLQQFVMFRVGEILEQSNITEWKWVPSKLNTADLATKVSSQLDIESWFTGPNFLTSEAEDWPTCDDLGPADTIEVRRHLLHTHTTVRSAMNINVRYFSDWRRLYRALATFQLYINKLKAVVKKGPTPSLSFEMLQNAKVQLYRCAQMQEYSQEITNLARDDTGILRTRSRAQNLNNRPDAIVLPKNHHVTFLIVRFYHENHHHVSHETIINKVRGMFYIPRLRVLYKSVRKRCQRCKNYYATPAVPQMAILPAARLAVFERPFTFVGIDYFGPISTIIGRRREKRWGVIFTCLTVRAIHIEVAHSLDTSSCIMYIRNFISRRGVPREIYSDNGTNFKASEKILCDEQKNINYSTVASKYDGIKWKFNPPATPHMGGAWERLVRSIKTILYRMAPMNFNDESLRSALWEVEFLINSRPLTFVSLESCDDEAITPNHLLLGSSTGYKPICKDNADLRQRWHQTQVFADEFWQRWIKDYTPMLARRGKWFVKQPPLAPGNVVVIVDENLPRNNWPRGIIESVVTAKDGQVRRVMVRTQTGMLERPASKIAVLDVVGKAEIE